MRNKLLDIAEQSSLREEPLNFTVGDTIDVHTRILEGNKERVQVFSGVVIARRGHGTSEMFTVRRIVQGEGVERTFPVHSPKIAKIEVKRHGRRDLWNHNQSPFDFKSVVIAEARSRSGSAA